VAVFRRLRTVENLLNEIDDGIAAVAQATLDLELGGRFLVLGSVGGGRGGSRAEGNEANGLALKDAALTNKITGR